MLRRVRRAMALDPQRPLPLVGSPARTVPAGLIRR